MRGRTLATVVAVEAIVFAFVVACTATNSSPEGDVIGDRPVPDAQVGTDSARSEGGGEGGGGDTGPVDAPATEDQRATDTGAGGG